MTKKEIVKRQKEIKIRLTDEEHQALLDRCTTASLASWMRETCLSEKRTKQSKVIEVDPKLLRQLAGILGTAIRTALTSFKMGDPDD